MPRIDLLKRLKPVVLNLSHTGVEDLLPLARIKSLRVIHINNTPAKILAPLFALPKLAKIYLHKGQISESHKKHCEHRGIEIIYVN